ncbi:MAG: hypothetical protein EBU23_14125 [Mycobacteriaceae bacterium]|nr:hypothetical protein [Mycobacteriaceae bacterium]
MVRKLVPQARTVAAADIYAAGASAAAPAGDAADAGDAGDPLAEEFGAVAAEVAAAKTRLDDIPAAAFAPLARGLDLYAGLKRIMRAEYGAPVATNATLKIFEMLRGLPAVPRTGPLAAQASGIRAFCNAELPGAFLVGINQYARQLPAALDWAASSYVPDRAAGAAADQTILDDEYGFLAGNPERWLVTGRPDAPGPAGNGDMTDAAAAGATLYTSDAGIDVADDYNNQEAVTAVLNFGQVLCGVLALAPGGTLLTKQYEFTLPFNRQLLMVLAGLFETLEIVKPRTSRPANSEVYVFGAGFRGVDPEGGLARALLGRLAAARAAAAAAPGRALPAGFELLAPSARDPAVDRALLRIARELAQNQRRFLLEMVAVMESCGARDIQQCVGEFARPAAKKAVASWLRANPLRRLPASDQIRAARL